MPSITNINQKKEILISIKDNLLLKILLFLLLIYSENTFSQIDLENQSDNGDSCMIITESEGGVEPPIFVFGFSFGFEVNLRQAFPIGSCENVLVEWLDNNEFGPARLSSLESHLGPRSEASERRTGSRLQTGERLHLRGRWQPALIGKHVYSVSWSADPEGRLTELYGSAVFFHFDLP